MAWHSPDLALQVVAADTMGVIEYGDADALSPAAAREMLGSLAKLSAENPRFLEWRRYRAGGIAQQDLLPKLAALLTDQGVEFGLRLLVLQTLEHSPVAQALAAELEALLLEWEAVFAIRSEAGDRLAGLADGRDWPALVRRLLALGGEKDVRLAIELMDEIGYDRFNGALVVETVLAQLERAEHSIGVLLGVEKRLPEDRVDAVLDGLEPLSLADCRAKISALQPVQGAVPGNVPTAMPAAPITMALYMHWLRGGLPQSLSAVTD